MHSLKTLHLDIETAPNLAYVWGLFKENIPLARIVNSGYVLCWAASWEGQKEIMFDSVYQSSPKKMLKGIHKLLSEADVVVHYNGKEFDIPTLNKEFVKSGLFPPAPYKQVDLIQVVRRQFRFPSNKLDYVLQALKLKQKVRHAGFEMWVQCMANDPKAWAMMEKYNKGDVRALKQLYTRLLPWIDRHPNLSVVSGDGKTCPRCGKHHLQRRGPYRVGASLYQRFQCQDCGGWSHSSQRISTNRGAHNVSM